MIGYNITDAREHLSVIFSKVYHQHEAVVLSRYGREEVVVIDRETWDRLRALDDAADVKAADRAMGEKGESIPYDQVRQELGL